MADEQPVQRRGGAAAPRHVCDSAGGRRRDGVPAKRPLLDRGDLRLGDLSTLRRLRLVRRLAARPAEQPLGHGPDRPAVPRDNGVSLGDYDRFFVIRCLGEGYDSGAVGTDAVNAGDSHFWMADQVARDWARMASRPRDHTSALASPLAKEA